LIDNKIVILLILILVIWV